MFVILILGEISSELDHMPACTRKASSLDVLLADPKHQSYYFVDTNIISAYVKNEIPSLTCYINRLCSDGRPHFFVTSRIATEFKIDGVRGEIPRQFFVFSDNDADQKAEWAYKAVMKRFNVKTDKFGVDMRWLLECGSCLHSCEHIPLEALSSPGSAFALTLNAKMVHRFLRSEKHRHELEEIVDEYGLEHLADLRLLRVDGTFEDLSAFDWNSKISEASEEPMASQTQSSSLGGK